MSSDHTQHSATSKPDIAEQPRALPWLAARVALLAGLTVVLVNAVGLRGVEGLEVQTLIRIEQVKDPTFLRNDLVASGLDYMGHQAWARLLAAATQWVSPETLLLGLYYATVFVTLAGMYHLALGLAASASARRREASSSFTAEAGVGRYTSGDAAALLAVALLAMFPHEFLAGQSPLYGRHYYEGWLSAGLLLFSLSYGVRNRPLAALVVAGLATNVHLLQGVQVAFLLTALFIVEALRCRPLARKTLARLAGGLLAFALLASPELYHAVRAVMLPAADSAQPVNSRDIIEIMGCLRAGHHQIPWQFAKYQHWGTALVLWLGLAAALAHVRTPEKTRAAILIVLIAAACAGLTPLITRHYLVMYLDVFRTMKFAGALAGALAAGLAVALLTKRPGWLAPLAAVTVLLWHVPMLCGAAAGALLLGCAWRRPEFRRPALAAGAAGIVLVVLAFMFVDARQDVLLWRGVFGAGRAVYLAWLGAALVAAVFSRWVRPTWLVAGAAGAAVALAAAWLVIDPVSYRGRHPEEAVFDWARRNTPPDAVFITPPMDLGEFRYHARRGVLAEMWLAPFKPGLVTEWFDRLNVLSRGELGRKRPEIVALRWESGREAMKRCLYENYRQLSAEELSDIGRRYGVRYCVMPVDAKLNLPVRCRGTRYQLLELPPPVAP